MRSLPFLVLLALFSACGCASDNHMGAAGTPQATSLLGEPLYPMDLSQEVLADRQQKLEIAQTNFDVDPTNEDNIIWLGRRLAYLGEYRQAIDVFSSGLQRYPDSARLLRHRGHRWITVREFERARDDLEKAAELIKDQAVTMEADGLPNKLGIPTSSTHTNIYYHLGLANYLLHDYEAAFDAYERCLSYADNNDMSVATLYWMYLTLSRQARHERAEQTIAHVGPDMEIIENHSYHKLLLLYNGHLDIADAAPPDDDIQSSTMLYGLANWHRMRRVSNHLYQKELQRVIAQGAWPAFGHIAAERDLSEMTDR